MTVAALAFLFGYLVGAVPLGLLVVKATSGVDIRRYGTGNIGASNVRHNVGLFPAVVVALGVFLQGLAPAGVVRLLGGPEVAVAAAAVGAMAGYGWPVFLGFKGGRGVGVATGAAAVISSGGFVLLLAAYALGGLLRQIALAVLLGFAGYAALTFYLPASTADRAAALSLLALLVVRRFDGVAKDLGKAPFFRVVADRLLFDRRPGQRLSGPAEGGSDTGPGGRWPGGRA